MRRYNATKRHGNILGQDLDLDAAVRADMRRMRDVEALADVVIDSSGLSPDRSAPCCWSRFEAY